MKRKLTAPDAPEALPSNSAKHSGKPGGREALQEKASRFQPTIAGRHLSDMPADQGPFPPSSTSCEKIC